MPACANYLVAILLIIPLNIQVRLFHINEVMLIQILGSLTFPKKYNLRDLLYYYY